MECGNYTVFHYMDEFKEGLKNLLKMEINGLVQSNFINQHAKINSALSSHTC